MRRNRILFAGIVMALIGAMFGLGVSEIQKQRYQCCDVINVNEGFSHSRAPRTYALIGAVVGFSIGYVQESIRQMQSEQEGQ